MVGKFRLCFGNVTYLVSLGFYDSITRDWTASMYKTLCPSKIFILNVQAAIPLSIVRYILTYHNNATCLTAFIFRFGKYYVSDSITTPRRILFSNATSPYSKFSVTPVVNKGSVLPSDNVIVNLVVTVRDQGVNVDDNVTSYAGGSKAGDKEDKSNSSYGSFDMKNISHAPEMARLLGGKSICSYHSTVGLLDDQAVFEQCTIRWNNMMLLVDNVASTTMVTWSEEIDNKIREMYQEIKFEVFCDRFKNAFVGYFFLLIISKKLRWSK